jgi:hypothetical protein
MKFFKNGLIAIGLGGIAAVCEVAKGLMDHRKISIDFGTAVAMKLRGRGAAQALNRRRRAGIHRNCGARIKNNRLIVCKSHGAKEKYSRQDKTQKASYELCLDSRYRFWHARATI